jgi:hypothetical protein
MLDYTTTHGKAEWLAYSELPLGHFADALFSAYQYADMGNRRRIEDAFSDLIDREFARWYGSAPY